MLAVVVCVGRLLENKADDDRKVLAFTSGRNVDDDELNAAIALATVVDAVVSFDVDMVAVDDDEFGAVSLLVEVELTPISWRFGRRGITFIAID
jgi:hypothetical protein